MSRFLCLTLTALLALAGVATTADAVSLRAPTLSVSPGDGAYTAGQQLTLRGSFGPGRRTVHIQSNMLRPGDVWRDIAGTTGRTTASGRFTLRMPAPAMYGIALRVVSGSRATPMFVSHVLHQQLSLTVTGGDDRLGEGEALVGTPMTLRAQSLSLPSLTGRPVALQRRVDGSRWAAVADGQLDASGAASWTITPAGAGEEVYRAVAGDWTGNGDQVGWFPSFPEYVSVLASAPRTSTYELRTPAAPARGQLVEVTERSTAPPQATASRNLRWGPARFDFDWEYGESLTSKPGVATVPRGRWADISSGTGRAALYNGALQLDTGGDEARGSTGTTAAQLSGSAQAYGRWETRVLPLGAGTDGSGFSLSVELVPTDPAAARCGDQDITVFRLSPGSPQPQIGVLSGSGRSWTRQVPGVSANNAFHAYAVEVTRTKITWFVDGRAVGKVTDRAAISGLPMTVRISTEPVSPQLGGGRALVDWVRAWPEGAGAKTRGGADLTPAAYETPC